MTIKKKVIDFLLANNGKLPENLSWYDLGFKMGVYPPDIERAKEDRKYVRYYITSMTRKYWNSYLKQKNKLVLTQEKYTNGKLISETYKKVPKDQPHSTEGMELEALTTNPHGGQWLKYKKKEKLYDDTHIQYLKELLVKEIKPQEKVIVSSNNSKGLFIHGSDKHIGALTKINSVYTNNYDREEIKKRLVYNTIQEIEEAVNMCGCFDALYIMEYGDALDGYNQKTTGGLRGTSSHTLPQQLNNREQHDFYVEVHKELFDIISDKKYAAEIYFIATSNSNHGGDFEYGAMRHLETYLNIKYPYIYTYVSDQSLNHFIYGEHCIIFGHGKDDEDMKHGFPLVLNEKIETYINDYIRVNKLEKYNISVISGDLHQSSETYGKGIRYRKVLSQFGSTKWMHTNFGSGSPGLSSEIIYKTQNKIIKVDKFFDIGDQSNTGIKF